MGYPIPATIVEARIMKVLSEGEAYGAQIAKQSNGLVKLGTVYGSLNRMEGHGWVTARVEVINPTGRGRRRKMYSLTNYGKSALYDYVSLIKRTRTMFEKFEWHDYNLEWLNETEWVKGF